MVQAITDQERQEIINQHYLGYTNEEISKNTDRGTGTVSAAISQHKAGLKEGNPSDVISLARNFKKSNISLEQVSKAAITNKKIQKANISLDSLDEMIQAVQKFPNTHPTDLFKNAERLHYLQKEIKKPLQEIPIYFEKLSEKSSKLKSEIAQLEKESSRLETTLKEKLKSKNITEKLLEEFDNTRKFLERIGLDLQDINKLERLFKIAKSYDYNIAKIMKRLSHEESFEKYSMKLDENIEQQESVLKHNQREIENQNRVIKTNKGIVDTINKFTTNKVTAEYLESFYAEVIHYSTKHHVPFQEAFQIFYQDLQLYDEDLKLQNKIKSLNQQKATLEKKINELTDMKNKKSLQIKELKTEKSKLEAQIEAKQNTYLKAITNYEKKITKSLQNQAAEFEESHKRFETAMKNAVAYYAKEDANRLTNAMNMFKKYMQYWVESMNNLGNLIVLEKLNELFQGNCNQEEINPIMIQILSSYSDQCKKENKTIQKGFTDRLLASILQTT